MHPLSSVREYYLGCFRESIAKARLEMDQFASELLLELPSLKHPDYCYRLYRADVVGKKDGKSEVREITVRQRDILDWRGFFPEVLSVDTPLVWYGIEFVVAGATPDEKALIDWTSRWIDIADARYVETSEFQEVVHSVTPPSTSVSGFSVSVDFGSAPTAAFDELAEILCRDARSVAVGSFFLFRAPNEEKPT